MRADTEQIDELIDSLPRQPYGTGSRREDCRELVREVRKQDDALIRQMLDALTNEQRMEVFNEAMKRCDENLNLPWRVAILEQVEIAHGITQKGGQHGADTRSD